MAHIRKRLLPSGKVRWQVIWLAGGKRQTAMYETQRGANEKRIAVEGLRPASTAKFKVMAERYLDYMGALVESGERERSYLGMLKTHINCHILPDREFSDAKCSALGTPEVQLFLNRLTQRIPAKSAAKVRITLSQVFKFGTQVGFAVSNPVREAMIRQKRRPEAGLDAPFDLPGKSDLKRLIDGAKTFDATGRAAAVIRILMYGGLRMSELRGLERRHCRLVGDSPSIAIVQRADRYNTIGSVKSVAGRRTVDLGPDTAQALRLWILAAPKAPPPGENRPESVAPPEYAFPNESGGVWAYPNFRSRFWVPLMNHCGLVSGEPAEKHIRVFTRAQASYHQPMFSPHTLRHVYASLQIEQGVSPKRLQKLIGHGTLKMTLDTYGHLWPDEDADRARARGVERMI